METRDLRIGNFINSDNVNCQVEAILLNGGIRTNGGDGKISEFTPINLTEKWLLRFGFEYMFLNEWMSIGMFGIRVKNFDYFVYGFPKGDEKDYFTLECKYVHQIQNLYFALTGKELSIIN